MNWRNLSRFLKSLWCYLPQKTGKKTEKHWCRRKAAGFFFDWVDVLSSVVRGSVLGRTLFNIFIDDVRKVVLDALIQMFTDDTKVALTIANEDNFEKMQKIIDNLVKWADKWKISFNTKKCKIIHVGHNNPRRKYYMKWHKLNKANDERNLGVFVKAKMKPGMQGSAAAKLPNFALGQIQHTFHCTT